MKYKFNDHDLKMIWQYIFSVRKNTRKFKKQTIIEAFDYAYNETTKLFKYSDKKDLIYTFELGAIELYCKRIEKINSKSNILYDIYITLYLDPELSIKIENISLGTVSYKYKIDYDFDNMLIDNLKYFKAPYPGLEYLNSINTVLSSGDTSNLPMMTYRDITYSAKAVEVSSSLQVIDVLINSTIAIELELQEVEDDD